MSAVGWFVTRVRPNRRHALCIVRGCRPDLTRTGWCCHQATKGAACPPRGDQSAASGWSRPRPSYRFRRHHLGPTQTPLWCHQATMKAKGRRRAVGQARGERPVCIHDEHGEITVLARRKSDARSIGRPGWSEVNLIAVCDLGGRRPIYIYHSISRGSPNDQSKTRWNRRPATILGPHHPPYRQSAEQRSSHRSSPRRCRHYLRGSSQRQSACRPVTTRARIRLLHRSSAASGRSHRPPSHRCRSCPRDRIRRQSATRPATTPESCRAPDRFVSRVSLLPSAFIT